MRVHGTKATQCGVECRLEGPAHLGRTRHTASHYRFNLGKDTLSAYRTISYHFSYHFSIQRKRWLRYYTIARKTVLAFIYWWLRLSQYRCYILHRTATLVKGIKFYWLDIWTRYNKTYLFQRPGMRFVHKSYLSNDNMTFNMVWK